jgi:hypothetical protein
MALTKKQIYFGVGGLALFVVWAKLKRGGDAAPGESIAVSVKEAVISAVDDIRSLTGWKEWTQKFYAAIARTIPEVTHEGRMIIIAQAVNEGGWTGKGRAAKAGFNFWNITASPSYKGDVWVDVNGDKSYQKANCRSLGRPMDFKDSKGRAYCKIDQRWRKWSSLEDAIRGYWSFMGANYAEARDLLQKGQVVPFIESIGKKGYYDIAIKQDYIDTMRSILKRANKYVA